MKRTVILTALLALFPVLHAKLSITLTSAGRNPIDVYITGPNENLNSDVRSDLNLSGWLQASTQRKDKQRSYHIHNKCVYANHDKALTCIQGNISTSKMAHIFADSIFEDITGKKSWFSSKIALVTSDMKGYKHRQYRLEVVDSRGDHAHTIFASPSPIMSPIWSPDGQSIAYVSFEKGKASIWRQNLQSGNRIRLSDATGINGAPAWSPNQQQMAIVLSPKGTPKLFLLDLSTSKVRPLTTGPSMDTEPFWNSDGTALYYTSSKGGNPQIYKIDIKTGHSTRVTYFGEYNATPTLSKDGKRMATLTRHNRRYMIVVHDLENGTHSILSAKGNEEQPMIHEGGEVVLFGTREGERMQIAMAQIDTPSRYQLPTDQGWARFAVWSPSSS